MKKLLIIMTLIVAVFMLAACGETETPPTPTNEPVSNGGEVTPTPEPEPTTQPVVDDGLKYSMGSWDGNVYTNEFLGMKYTMPEGWTKYSNDQINELYQGVLDNNQDLFKLDTEELKKAINESAVFYVFSINNSTGSNVQIMSEKPAVKVTVDQYMEALKEGLGSVSSVEYSDLVISKANIGGIDFNTLTATATVSGITMKQAYYTIPVGELFVSIIATDTSNEINISELISKI